MKKLIKKVRRTIFEISDRTSSGYQIASLIATRLSKENNGEDFVVYNDHNGHYIIDVEYSEEVFKSMYASPRFRTQAVSNHLSSLKQDAREYKATLKLFFK